jgi:RHS repeat-associated protein
MRITPFSLFKTLTVVSFLWQPMVQVHGETVVGSIPAEFNVSGGNASYSIPIQVAPGRGGMQPDLSLNYTGGGNGVLGVGWSLGGLSSIHRCPANLEQDGFISGITFTDKDRYCLDGQRLIPVSGTNGAVGTEYRTEIDGYAQIKSYGGSVNNPSYFIAKTKAGQVITFGGGNASLKFSSWTTNWSVESINDSTVNNPITYEYFVHQNTQYLNSITYEGGKVELSYQGRSDIDQKLFSSIEYWQAYRLEKIRTFSGSHFVKDYKLTYSSTGGKPISVISSIQECDNSNNCLAPANISWSSPGNTVYSSHIFNTPISGGDFREVAYWKFSGMHDTNNDGLVDAVWIYSGADAGTRVGVSLSQGSGVYGDFLLSQPILGGDFRESAGWSFSGLHDTNGDNLLDAVWIYSGASGTRVAISLSLGNGYYGALLINKPILGGDFRESADWKYTGMKDVNGDGLLDATWVYSGISGTRVGVSLSQGNGSYGQLLFSSPILGGDFRHSAYWAFSGFHDTNKDGLLDAIWTYSGISGTRVAVSLSLGNGFYGGLLMSTSAAGGDFRGSADWQFSEFVDINGDTVVDAIWIYSGASGIRISVSLGLGNGTYGSHQFNFSSPILGGDFRSSADWFFSGFHDVNLDGLPDATWVYSGISGVRVATSLSKGNGSFMGLAIHTPISGGDFRVVKNWSFAGFKDTNADDYPDAVWAYSGTAGTRIAVSSAIGNGNYGSLTISTPASGGDFRKTANWEFAGFHDVNGNGVYDVAWVNSGASGTRVDVSLSESREPRLAAITDAVGNRIDIFHKPLTDPTVYTKGTGAQYPVIDLQYPQYVVSSVTTSNGIGGTSTVNYHYEGLKSHVRGRGSYGYAKITETYPETGKTQETVFNQTGFPLTGNVDRVVEKLNGQIINESDTTYSVTSANGVYQVNVDQSVDKSYELNGDLITTVATAYSNIDAYGNVGQVSVTTTGNGESFTKITDSTYTNDLSNWYLGRLTETTVTHQAPAQADQQRRSQFGYDSTTGLLNSQSIISMATGLPLNTTSYQYDAYGHKTQVTVSAAGETDRTTTTAYNNEGKPTQTCNALNQCESYTYTPQGWLASTTGPNGITTQWEYDGFGRKTKEIRADGTQTTIAHHFATPLSGSPQCGTLATYAYTCTITHTTGSQPQITQFDRLGRNVRSIATGFDGRLIYSDTQYNALAQVSRVSRNYFEGEQIYWANSQYDPLGRVTQMDEPAPHGTRNIINTSYSGLTTMVTSGSEQRQKTTVTNAIGQVIHRAEEEGSYIDYTYTADGNLKTTTVAGDSTTSITLSYDEFGRKIAMDDPDMGQWSYTYNAFGQLISQTDAKNQTTTMVYDILGRMTSRTEAEGTSTWVYGDHTAPQGSIGKLLSETNAGITKTYFYDSFGRPDEVTTDITGEQSFSTQTLYDSIGRVSRTIYPGNDNFYTENLYNAHGFLEKVRGLRSNSEQYDLNVLTPLVSSAIDLADDYHAKAIELQSIGATYQNKIAQYQALIDAGTTSGSLDSHTQTALNQHQTALNAQVTTAQNNAAEFYGHLNNTIVELQTVTDLINTQVQSYQDTVEQLTVLAEQTLAAADNSFQYERTLSRGATAYTELVNDTQYTNYWRAIDVDASGRISAEVYGNGITNDYTYNQATGQLQQLHSSLLTIDPIRDLEYQYDEYQNVTSREDHANDIRETFEYDRLDRLTRTDIVSATYISTEFNGSQTQSYDALGNITHKSDVGHYTYGAGIAGPHAVTQVAGSKNTSYTYDSNGNMTSGDGRQITWSSFNKPTLITKGASSATFAYGPDRARYKKTNHAGHTTLYVGQLYEQVTKGNNVEEKHYIYANGQLVAEHIVSTAHGVQTRYLHKDALGSVDLVTDAYANVVDRRSFDAWGKLRNLTWQDSEGINNILYLTQLPFTNKGFTGHENIQEVGLIHMNGRVYDATLARFLSSDPHIQSGALTQSYNRYSYVMNNPLKYTDPSGYFFKKVFRAIKKVVKKVAKALKKVAKAIKPYVGVIVGALVSIYCQVCGSGIIKGALAGAAAGAAGAAANGGNILKGALTGAISGATFAHIGGLEGISDTTRVAYHALAGGTMNVIQGGKFGAGFLSAGFAKFATLRLTANGTFDMAKQDFSRVMGRTAVAAVVGGTASVIGGGKFKNGATTAAMAHLLNGELSVAEAKRSFHNKYGDILEAGNIDIGQNVSDASGMSTDNFINNVKNGGVWDYKNSRRYGSLVSQFGSDRMQEFGNVHFGVVAAAHGFPLAVSLAGAGGYQAFRQKGGARIGALSSPILAPNGLAQLYTRMGFQWGDNPGDSSFITRGHSYHNNVYGCHQASCY